MFQIHCLFFSIVDAYLLVFAIIDVTFIKLMLSPSLIPSLANQVV